MKIKELLLIVTHHTNFTTGLFQTCLSLYMFKELHFIRPSNLVLIQNKDIFLCAWIREKRFIVLFRDTAQHHMLHIIFMKLIKLWIFLLHNTFNRSRDLVTPKVCEVLWYYYSFLVKPMYDTPVTKIPVYLSHYCTFITEGTPLKHFRSDVDFYVQRILLVAMSLMTVKILPNIDYEIEKVCRG